MSVEAYVVDGVYLRVTPSAGQPGRYLALAKREPFHLPGADAIREPGEVWFDFGHDRAALIDQLVAEVKAAR